MHELSDVHVVLAEMQAEPQHNLGHRAPATASSASHDLKGTHVIL